VGEKKKKERKRKKKEEKTTLDHLLGPACASIVQQLVLQTLLCVSSQHTTETMQLYTSSEHNTDAVFLLGI
jgi:hypothetical protein